MIDAKQAKQLYDESGVEVQTFLTHTVEKKVKDAAESGKRFVFICLGAEPVYHNVQPDNIQKAAMEELKKLGYKVVFQRDGESYVPRGLADDDGNGPSHTNYGIQISW